MRLGTWAQVLRYFLLFLLFALPTAVVMIEWTRHQQLIVLRDHGRTTTARVLAIRRQNRGQQVIFEYRVRNVSYEGRHCWSDDRGSPKTVQITYLPERPAIHYPGDVTAHVLRDHRNQATTMFVLLTLLPAIAVLGCERQIKLELELLAQGLLAIGIVDEIVCDRKKQPTIRFHFVTSAGETIHVRWRTTRSRAGRYTAGETIGLLYLADNPARRLSLAAFQYAELDLKVSRTG